MMTKMTATAMSIFASFSIGTSLNDAGADDKGKTKRNGERNQSDRPVIFFNFLVHIELGGQKFK